MRRVTTPIHTFKFPEEIKVGQIDKLVASYCQGAREIFKKELGSFIFDLANNSVEVMLSQEETKIIRAGATGIQVRVKLKSGFVLASQILTICAKPSLNEEIL